MIFYVYGISVGLVACFPKYVCSKCFYFQLCGDFLGGDIRCHIIYLMLYYITL